MVLLAVGLDGSSSVTVSTTELEVVSLSTSSGTEPDVKALANAFGVHYFFFWEVTTHSLKDHLKRCRCSWLSEWTPQYQPGLRLREFAVDGEGDMSSRSRQITRITLP